MLALLWFLQFSFLFVLLCKAQRLYFQDFGSVPDRGNYSCDEIIRWLGSEKHYSNDKKDVLFGLLANQDCKKNPVIFLSDVSFGHSANGKRMFFKNLKGADGKRHQCSVKDRLAVAYLSNFSINNNFSHFLHGLLRLFCALIDARWIVWDESRRIYVKKENYTLWLDEYFKVSPSKLVWLKSMTDVIRPMGKEIAKGNCISASSLLYGSGCVKLLPPEKWFGYPGCRAQQVLPAFGQYMRQVFGAASPKQLLMVHEQGMKAPGIRVSFAVRAVGDLTGRREVSNLGYVQSLLRKTQHVKATMENVTFEHLDVPSTVRYMAGIHIFVSVHGAGMTNMFFMNPGSAVVEIIPYPLCNCRSPDYFYGAGGYYHGSAAAQNILHYAYCVPPQDQKWHEKPADAKPGAKCSWKHLHAVESLTLDPTRFVSIMRKVERDLVVAGTVQLTSPVINMGPHANGRA